MTEISYERRQRDSLAMMAAAADPSCARMIHRRLALEYGKLAEADRLAKAAIVAIPADLHQAPYAAGIPANDGAVAIRNVS